MGKIYMIGAMKGGVGKSVSVFNLAYSLRKRGKKVLAVDFDPQSNLTTCFGADEVDVAIGDLMMDVIEEEELPERLCAPMSTGNAVIVTAVRATAAI